MDDDPLPPRNRGESPFSYIRRLSGHLGWLPSEEQPKTAEERRIGLARGVRVGPTAIERLDRIFAGAREPGED